MKKIILVLVLSTLCFGYAQQNSGKVTEVDGNIHFYGDRYIVKGVGDDYGKWFVLLESPLLEKLSKSIDLFSRYKIKGKIYMFNDTKYLLPTTLKTQKAQHSSKISKNKAKNKKSTGKSKGKSKKAKKKSRTKKGKKKTKKKRKSKKSMKKKTKKQRKKESEYLEDLD
ncbi:hypothetical protein [Candidatus Uabimicrobium amorphum]|uniref:Uncharacterized protein n=1 Tax=Uabimicrobium amorphum TaxID=2596890 RepID=A0A5S9IPY5_UABAM|nr:hypothetical protein [Candidatus Uabimicrobium amorphum]BBM85938.1 hypothetical protein UABAM_04324 [Candidatus Uabimicrobium amorphum]